jgi:hypothetical protein
MFGVEIYKNSLKYGWKDKCLRLTGRNATRRMIQSQRERTAGCTSSSECYRRITLAGVWPPSLVSPANPPRRNPSNFPPLLPPRALPHTLTRNIARRHIYVSTICARTPCLPHVRCGNEAGKPSAPVGVSGEERAEGAVGVR